MSFYLPYASRFNFVADLFDLIAGMSRFFQTLIHLPALVLILIGLAILGLGFLLLRKLSNRRQFPPK